MLYFIVSATFAELDYSTTSGNVERISVEGFLKFNFDQSVTLWRGVRGPYNGGPDKTLHPISSDCDDTRIEAWEMHGPNTGGNPNESKHHQTHNLL